MSDGSDNEIEIKNRNVPKKLSVNEELYLIAETIENLEGELDRYINETKILWDEHFKKFIDSSDCLTMDYIGIQGYDKFVNLMTQQKTFRLMQISLKRLHQRKNFLIKCR